MSEDTTPHTHEDGTEHTHEDAQRAVTGFAVFVDQDGRISLERNPDALTIPLEREASLIDVRRCISEILMDIQAQTAAEYTVMQLAVQERAKNLSSQETPAE
jgi:hypothetical protein